jgi:hypothetical protein
VLTKQGRASRLTGEERITLKVCTDALAEGWTVGNRRAEELVRIIERLTGEKFLEEQ